MTRVEGPVVTTVFHVILGDDCPLLGYMCVGTKPELDRAYTQEAVNCTLFVMTYLPG